MTGRARALVLLNPAAGHGSAHAKYARARAAVEARFLARTELLDADGAWKHALRGALADGTRVFLAAGGDGTVSALTGELVAAHGDVPLPQITLGAVGLGSSNDFHKPVRHTFGGIPLRIDPEGAVSRDIVRVRYRGDSGPPEERCFVVSASFGATAEANAFFNDGDPLLRELKRHWVGASIVYAALRTLRRYTATKARLVVAGEQLSVPLANLSVMKTPHLSGCFRYDTPVAPGSGLVAVNLCQAESRRSLLLTLANLVRGHFVGRPGTRHWMASELEVELDGEHLLELDGETVRARQAQFDLLPERILACA